MPVSSQSYCSHLQHFWPYHPSEAKSATLYPLLATSFPLSVTCFVFPRFSPSPTFSSQKTWKQEWEKPKRLELLLKPAVGHDWFAEDVLVKFYFRVWTILPSMKHEVCGFTSYCLLTLCGFGGRVRKGVSTAWGSLSVPGTLGSL